MAKVVINNFKLEWQDREQFLECIDIAEKILEIEIEKNRGLQNGRND